MVLADGLLKERFIANPQCSPNVVFCGDFALFPAYLSLDTPVFIYLNASAKFYGF